MSSNVIKEARKKAQEFAFVLKQTGNDFLVTQSDMCQGRHDDMVIFMKTLNENKPANSLGKIIFSSSDDFLIGCIDIPEHLQTKLSKSECSFAFLSAFPYLHRDDTHSFLFFQASNHNEIFPFKLRDELIQFGINFLKKDKKIIQTVESDDEIDYAQEIGIEW